MLTLAVADDPGSLGWATAKVVVYHYLGSAPDPRGRPLCYVVQLGSERVGCLWFARPQSAACYEGRLTYGSQADVKQGRAAFDRWEVLNLARVWLSPRVQAGGDLCREGAVPGFCDRGGVWRPAFASAAIRLALARVGHDYLTAYPPVWVGAPYPIRAVLSYCDPRRHRGTIYRAAGFSLARRNDVGMETWWTAAVAPLEAWQDAEVRSAAARSDRGAKVRARERESGQRELFGPAETTR